MFLILNGLRYSDSVRMTLNASSTDRERVKITDRWIWEKGPLRGKNGGGRRVKKKYPPVKK